MPVESTQAAKEVPMEEGDGIQSKRTWYKWRQCIIAGRDKEATDHTGSFGSKPKMRPF